ncbi:hypothetical protein [Methanofollis fontis]|uniref:DUF1616 domain-containing protein n=1 Tax=Methanofollis fontis TaxID=2052832 RepID=A0A483CYP0_9EURY|nr:hypothetical protein [Methanofollis fontis]TAJ44856.1 hypothetical protein CUJ86_06100 [Methanofollis fontis]
MVLIESSWRFILLVAFISAIVLMVFPLLTVFEGPTACTGSPWKVDTVNIDGTQVIRVAYTCDEGGGCPTLRAVLIDPEGHPHEVGEGVVQECAGRQNTTWYIFQYTRPEAGTPRFWITNEPAMIFSDDYIPAIEGFEPPGLWVVDLSWEGEESGQMSYAVKIGV